ncbi:unnamed protein product [Peronospora belbahrii]|uniref:Uncharacterized protein n=1 Tax=Peronospora belbahrii TaxID=622444 RepID=A0AAU9KKS8_9STRA|nr:unnamed protein product [Peronospora belbahrii]CAH0520525.1 unnamed protein product [Peronospora belbahrii]
MDLLSGRSTYFYHQLLELISTYLSFAIMEPGVPELLSEDEVRDVDEHHKRYLHDIPPLPMDDRSCNEALAKLVQVKMQHANRIISRPDDWLVFDPVQEKLVLQKHLTGVRENHKCLNKHYNGSKLGHCRERELIEDCDQASLFDADVTDVQVMQTEKNIDTNVKDIRVMRTGKNVDTDMPTKRPPEVAT